ncbi:unnamed protein product [Cladocopium goreaui]|uniref:Gamma-tubulin complex component 4-like n=1 Tax=Cladocopium goreaui TaxID=2562237 RepID=A0A9P1DLM5_9DINO|nr:unnamed protein product [Cladocopium goreaui]
MDQKRVTTQRKRSACGQLRTLALELGVEEGNARLDMTIQQFDSLANDLEMRCTTPQQRGKLRQVVAHLHNRPAVPPLPGSVPAAAPREPEDREAAAAGRQFRLRRWSATMEQSLKSEEPGRVHLHVFMEFGQAVAWTSLRCVVFMGVTRLLVLPVALVFAKLWTTDLIEDSNTDMQRTFKVLQFPFDEHRSQMVLQLPLLVVTYIVHRYDWMDFGIFIFLTSEDHASVSTVNWAAWNEYMERYRVRIGFMGRQRQVDCVREHERKLAFQAQQRQVADALAMLMRPFRPEVLSRLQPWVSQYQSVQLRYKFLVLRGGSQTGKSTLAKSLGHLFGSRRPFVQTVQSAEAPDLKAYSPEEHGYILFDNVNHMDFILHESALFQANNDLHTLGASRTGIYSYSVWLFRCPLVVTVDLSAVWEGSEPWLADNMFELFLDGPCYL